MQPWVVRGSIFLTAVIVVVVFGAWMSTNALKNDLINVGFTNVEVTHTGDGKVTATLHGCKLGFDRQATAEEPRTINTAEIPPFNVSLVDNNGTWTPIPGLKNKASTRDEVARYMGEHRQDFACYTPDMH